MKRRKREGGGNKRDGFEGGKGEGEGRGRKEEGEVGTKGTGLLKEDYS